ncbi:MAG: hypothetical protein IT473_16315, partial [Lysobacter sp.]|nr:hypothetical protein [Lysobacter sp.]
RCTPIGYALHGVAGLLGFIGLLLLLAALVYLAHRGVNGTFEASLLWLPAVALGFGLAGWSLTGIARSLAKRKSFRYDYASRVSRWVEDGAERTHTFDDWQADRKR